MPYALNAKGHVKGGEKMGGKKRKQRVNETHDFSDLSRRVESCWEVIFVDVRVD